MYSGTQVRRYPRALWGALLALLIAGLLSLQLASSVSADVSVNIMNFKFDPTPLTIPVGTTVVWTNQDTAAHTATSDPGSAFTFDTGLLQKGQSGKITFNQVGTFTYFCSVHPNMHGTVVVTAAGSAASSPTTGTGSTTGTSPNGATGSANGNNQSGGNASGTTAQPSASAAPVITAPPAAAATAAPTATTGTGSTTGTTPNGATGSASGNNQSGGNAATTATQPPGILPPFFNRRLGDG